tara:strand:+ start:532 stop:1305 length:774 start_codon:yes stop_codon:yes gene_type:complete
MKSFIKKIAKFDSSIKLRNLLGFRPVALNSNKLKQNFSISDGFLWRTDNNYKTNFKYSDLLKIFYDNNDSSIEIHFYDKNNNLIKKINKLNIDISNNFLINKEFLNGMEDYGIFYIYHKSDKQLSSSVRNSCYTGYSYKNQLESYVHGNCPTSYKPLNQNIARKITHDIVGRSIFINQNYKIQRYFNDLTKSEIFIQNPTSKKIKFLINKTRYELNEKCCLIIDTTKLNEIEIISNCYFLRPLVFCYKNNYIDVHHG